MSMAENELSDVRKKLVEQDDTIKQLREAFFAAHAKGYARALEDVEVVVRAYGGSKKVIQKIRELIDHESDDPPTEG